MSAGSRLAATAVATAAAGACALARRRVAALPPTMPRDAPIPGEPVLLSALANWTPPPPATPAGRVAGYVWAAPLTAAGVAVGLASGARPTVRQGVLVFSPAGGIGGWALRKRGFSATTWGHAVLSRTDPGPPLLAHELVHTRQAERLGILLAPLYLGLTAVYGYHRNPMERAARAAARPPGHPTTVES